MLESRENPVMNLSNLSTTLEFHGNVQGRMLLDYGFSEKQIPDPLRDYAVQAWLIGQYLIKVQMSPSPRRRHPFFVTSFEKVPGTACRQRHPRHHLRPAGSGQRHPALAREQHEHLVGSAGRGQR